MILKNIFYETSIAAGLPKLHSTWADENFQEKHL